MKTLALSIFFFLLTISMNAQESIALQQLPKGWEVSTNWLHSYHEVIQTNGSVTWISDMIADGALMYTHQNSEGMVLIMNQEEEGESLKEFAEMAIIENNNVRLMPIGQAEAFGTGFKVLLRGTLGGKTVVVQKICLPCPELDQFVSVLSVIPQMNSGPDSESFAAGYSIASRIYAETQIQQIAHP